MGSNGAAMHKLIRFLRNGNYVLDAAEILVLRLLGLAALIYEVARSVFHR